MRKSILFFVIYFLSIFNNSFSQLDPFSAPVRLTNGNNDRNPSFGNSRDYDPSPGYEWEYMTFERINGNSSNICVTKIGDSGSMVVIYRAEFIFIKS